MTSPTMTDPVPVREYSADYRVGLGLRELRGTGELVRLFVERDLKLRYAQTLLGPIWVILQPLAPALLFTFVFTKIVNVNTGGVPYLLFVTTAMAPWNFVSRALQRGGPALIADRSLVTKVFFPRLTGQISVVASSSVDLLVSLVIIVPAMVHAHWTPTWRFIFLPVVMAWAAVLALGVSTLTAAFSVKHRDVVQALPLLTQCWLYATPIAYPIASVKLLRPVILLNPMTSLVEATRWSIVGHTTLTARDIFGGALIGVAILIIGLLAFHRADWDLADVL